jgi:DNA polymerase (family 10)
MSVSNEEIAQLFENMASFLEMKGDAVFKVRAYQRAARTIEQLPFELEQAVAEGMDLKKVPGIGKAINDKIYELVQTSKVSAYEKLLSELPQGALEIMTIPSVGPKTARLIAKELGVSTIEELEQAIRAGKVAGLPGLGGKTADNILHHIESMRIKDQRTPIGEALSIAERVVSVLREKCPHIGQLYPAGSLRRWEETIGDIDLVGTSPHPEEVSQALVSLPEVQEVLGHGTKKTSVVVKPGMQIDLRMGDDESFGALLQCFTGNRQHNIRLRDYANRMGLSLNEYGITDIASGKMEVFPDEASFYARLDLPYIPPEIRTGMGELEVALEGKLPRLVEESDLKGDLHLHSNWSDGRDSIEVMLEAVAAQGYEYMALTDHSSGRGIANGLSNERLLKQTELLRSFQEKYSMTILCGSEVDIRADGTMDYPDELLEQLDVVVASVHSAMGQDRETMTRRVIKAMEHPSVTIIGHLSTRLIGQRPPTQFDPDAILHGARDTGTAMELNASPERLDLKDTHAYWARELGVPLVINTDSHHHSSLGQRRFGVAVARRAWCEAHHILNTMPRDQFLTFIRTPKPERTKLFDQRMAQVASV